MFVWGEEGNGSSLSCVCVWVHGWMDVGVLVDICVSVCDCVFAGDGCFCVGGEVDGKLLTVCV